MRKTEVYSWRISPPLKSALEEAARAQRISVAELLDRVTGEWLAGRVANAGAAEQARLLAAAMRFSGSLRGGDPDRAAQASARLRVKLKARRAG